MSADLHVPLLMGRLAVRRPVFHSEADFQHALAWQIQIEHPNSAIRLETRPTRGIHLDMLVVDDGRRTAIELKYLADRFEGVVLGEHFALPRQGAHDISRHDACKDIWRIETMIAEGYADTGAAIVLTNDGGYWRQGTKADPIDACVRIHEGRTIDGTLQWAPHAGAGTTRSRLDPLPLRGTYPCRWVPYSELDRADGRRVEFGYLHHSVNGIDPANPPETLAEPPS
jgi:hypothetical protein